MYPDLGILCKYYFRNGIKIGKIREKGENVRILHINFVISAKTKQSTVYIFDVTIYVYPKPLKNLKSVEKKAWLGIFEREKAIKAVF